MDEKKYIIRINYEDEKKEEFNIEIDQLDYKTLKEKLKVERNLILENYDIFDENGNNLNEKDFIKEKNDNIKLTIKKKQKINEIPENNQIINTNGKKLNYEYQRDNNNNVLNLQKEIQDEKEFDIGIIQNILKEEEKKWINKITKKVEEAVNKQMELDKTTNECIALHEKYEKENKALNNQIEIKKLELKKLNEEILKLKEFVNNNNFTLYILKESKEENNNNNNFDNIKEQKYIDFEIQNSKRLLNDINQNIKKNNLVYQNQITLLNEMNKEKKKPILIKEEEIKNKLNSFLGKIEINCFNKYKDIFDKTIKKINNEQMSDLLKLSKLNNIKHNKECRKCGQNPIIGILYKCSECKDFYLCDKCEQKNFIDKIHPHDFIKIRKSSKKKFIIGNNERKSEIQEKKNENEEIKNKNWKISRNENNFLIEKKKKSDLKPSLKINNDKTNKLYINQTNLIIQNKRNKTFLNLQKEKKIELDFKKENNNSNKKINLKIEHIENFNFKNMIKSQEIKNMNKKNNEKKNTNTNVSFDHIKNNKMILNNISFEYKPKKIELCVKKDIEVFIEKKYDRPIFVQLIDTKVVEESFIKNKQKLGKSDEPKNDDNVNNNNNKSNLSNYGNSYFSSFK